MKDKLSSIKSKNGFSFRDRIADLYDVFEPALILHALTVTEKSKKISLGHLIFGQAAWDKYKVPVSSGDDPLTKMFRTCGQLYFS